MQNLPVFYVTLFQNILLYIIYFIKMTYVCVLSTYFLLFYVIFLNLIITRKNINICHVSLKCYKSLDINEIYLLFSIIQFLLVILYFKKYINKFSQILFKHFKYL